MRSRQTKRLMVFFVSIMILTSYDVNATSETTALTSAYLPLVYAVGSVSTPTLPATDWLSYINSLRGLANLPTISENATFSDGAYKHAKYMVKNDVIAHNEDPGKPFYTTEGNVAATKSNVMVSSTIDTTDTDAIDMWMTGPFHGIGLIDPQLVQSGYGAYREEDGGWQMGAALDVLRGLASGPPASVTFPIKWPADGKTSWLTTYDGNESPDPLTSCAGYSAPTGAPIYLQIGTGSSIPNATSATLTRSGVSLPICFYTEMSYTNPESSSQVLGRNVLNSRDAVVMIPKNPLTPGSYSVSMTVNGTVHAWSFTIANTTPSRTSTASDQLGTDALPVP